MMNVIKSNKIKSLYEQTKKKYKLTGFEFSTILLEHMNVSCLFPTDKKVSVRFFITETKTYSLLTSNYCKNKLFDTLMSHFHFQEEATY